MIIRFIKQSFTLSCLMVFFSLLILSGCTPSPRYSSRVQPRNKSKQRISKKIISTNNFKDNTVLSGHASFYGPGFHGKKTANGETYDQNALTCAHKTLPFGTLLRVTYLKSGLSVEVRVNDRGPFVKGRILDLSVEAARRIGMYVDGTGEISAVILKMGSE